MTVVAPADLDAEAPPRRNDGPMATALLAGGIGAFALGVVVISSEAIPAWKSVLNVFNPVGPLSGKTIGAVLAFGRERLGARWYRLSVAAFNQRAIRVYERAIDRPILIQRTCGIAS